MSKAWASVSNRKWRQLRLIVLDRDHWRCKIHGPKCLTIATTVDHIVSLADGGSDIESNLRAACGPCNYGREGSTKPQDPAPNGLW